MTGSRVLRTFKAGCTAAALTLAGACASSTGPTKANSSDTLGSSGAAGSITIAQALSSIPDTGWDEGLIAFGATVRMTALDGSNDPGPYSTVYGLVDELIPLYGGPQGEPQEVATLGFDPQKAPFTVTVMGGSRSVSSATTLFGSFDMTTIAAKLAATGFTRTGSSSGATTWAYKSSGNGLEFPMTADNDSVPGAISISPSRLVFSPTASPVSSISASATKPLIQNPTVDALATCLGPATAGLVGRLYQQPNVPGATHAALGITAGSGSTTTVEVCVAADSPSVAQGMKTRWITGVRTGKDSESASPWSSMLTNPQAADEGTSVVRLSAELTSKVTPSLILDQYLSGRISTLILPPSS
ncbi:hypothetical protein [Actinospica robiniae]|uniref:hypothetical protein n=1 Tax=Actinospica robiniae TaxID=304901 RepID=UPI00040178B1|nr:hypothetical protein [Actinospica robiniae]